MKNSIFTRPVSQISMAKIKFNVNSKKNPANLNVRFYHGKEIDRNALTHTLIDPKIWSNKM